MEEHEDDEPTMKFPNSILKSNHANKFGTSTMYSPAKMIIIDGDISLLRDDVHSLQKEVASLRQRLEQIESLKLLQASISQISNQCNVRLDKLETMAQNCINIMQTKIICLIL